MMNFTPSPLSFTNIISCCILSTPSTTNHTGFKPSLSCPYTCPTALRRVETFLCKFLGSACGRALGPTDVYSERQDWLFATLFYLNNSHHSLGQIICASVPKPWFRYWGLLLPLEVSLPALGCQRAALSSLKPNPESSSVFDHQHGLQHRTYNYFYWLI